MPELPHGEPVQWLWLLHDDCAPAPDALAELLRVADAEPLDGHRRPQAAQLVRPPPAAGSGRHHRPQRTPLDRAWSAASRTRASTTRCARCCPSPPPACSSAATSTRSWAASTAGCPLMRDDVDLCWRAHAAGHQVLIAPDAVLRHAEASARERRPIDCVGRSVANPHRVDKAGAVYTLLANTRGALLPYVLLRLLLGTLLRDARLPRRQGPRPGARRAGRALRRPAATRQDPRRPAQTRPARRGGGRPAAALPAARRDRARHRRAGRRQLRRPGRARCRRPAGRHGAVESGPGGDDADFLEVEQFARLKRIARRPGPVLFAAPAAGLADRLPRTARRRRAGRRRPAARPRAGVRPVGARTSTAGTRSASAAPPPRRPTWRSSRCVADLLLRQHRLRPDPAAGLLRAAGRAHRLLRLPPAGRLPAAAGLGQHRVRLPARRHRARWPAAGWAPRCWPSCCR